jgi:hypothetical protein
MLKSAPGEECLDSKPRFYPWGYAADRLGVCENNIGNGGKHKKELTKNTENESWSFGLQRETYVKVITRPAHH